jgi:hypothetical protein
VFSAVEEYGGRGGHRNQYNEISIFNWREQVSRSLSGRGEPLSLRWYLRVLQKPETAGIVGLMAGILGQVMLDFCILGHIMLDF